MLRALVTATLFGPFLPSAATAAETELTSVRHEAFAGQSNELRIDYSLFSDILGEIVFDAGPSDRRPAFGRVTQTGTRINRTNTSRYRFEGNRVIYHLFTEGHVEAISAYRRELEALPSQIDFSSLSENEQLAYWFNLHNVVVIDELAKAYPVRRPSRLEIDGIPLMDAPIVTLPDGAVSLNHIRHEIVAENWNDPRVMYGFFTGEVGGPSIQDEAFRGATVWSQLNSVAREFVNSLRGVDFGERTLQISQLYFDYDALFGDDEEAIRAHLLNHAEFEVVDLVGSARGFRAADYDLSVADLTNGQICGGGIVGQLEITTGARRTFNGGCDVLPPVAIELVGTIQERKIRLFREGRLGRVEVRDIPTVDPDDASD